MKMFYIVENGVYQVILGNFKNLTPELFNDERYIGLSIGDDIELKPRQKITSVVFSIKNISRTRFDIIFRILISTNNSVIT